MSKGKNEDTWVVCPDCETKLKKENIAAHLKNVHDKKIKDVDESSIKVLHNKGKKQKKSMNFSFRTIAIILVIMIVIATAAFFVLSGPSNDQNNNGAGENSDNSDWLDDYTPVHSVSNGADDFWITYPDSNPQSGSEVDHLNWIVNDIKNKPVLFVVHITGCAGCHDQAERVIDFGKEYDEYVKFYDLDAVSNAPADITQKANEVYKYDPTGSPGYIALTGLYTYVKDNGEVKIGWHTWEAPNDMKVSNADLETWIKDAIYYHNINKEEI